MKKFTREISNTIVRHARNCTTQAKATMTAVGSLYFMAMGSVPVFATTSVGTDFFNSGVDIMQMILVAIGAVILIMGIINFLEAYSTDNPGPKSQGQKQFIAGAGIIIVSLLLIPELKTLITM